MLGCPRPEEVFAIGARAFAQAADRVAVLEWSFRIAGFDVLLRFAGPALIGAATRALEHLATPPPAAPALVISLWDAASTKSTEPAASIPHVSEVSYWRGEVYGLNDKRFSTFYHGDLKALSLVNHETNEALFWVEDAETLPTYAHGAPLVALLHSWLERLGLQVVHAAAVGRADGGVLIVGEGGAGKSTTALSCLQSDLRYAGDDYCLVGAGVCPRVFSLYSSAKVTHDHLSRLPHLAPLVQCLPNGGEKAVLFLSDHYAERLIPAFPLRGILLARISGRATTELRKMSRAEVVRGWMPSTIRQLPRAGRAAFERMTQIAKQVPAWGLELGTDLLQIPAAIEDCLERAADGG